MNFIIDNIWLIVLVVASGGMLFWPALQQRGKKLTHLQATQLINQGKALILDVRTPEEFATGHLPEARNIPLKDLPQRVTELDKFKSKSLIVVCANGMQSPKALGRLKSAGFAQAHSLAGGLTAWQAQGLPVTKAK